ncbi:unnamed protein product [Fusarium graminearum]|uniref:Chromosome 1, complete genome n=1 Tax=Gibberella zeae (strain ATCC MYA-4620 / CBS 123657 / FGSC 9075 / NRRL 31084 / PH-1) TaxID=229533 RepID=A0A0E0RWR4_GIBZE|nr:hypothetical protein FG05_30254 [Fusarium graminearum]CEF75689.1 unnamed protein product [Fusarium graminearum]
MGKIILQARCFDLPYHFGNPSGFYRAELRRETTVGVYEDPRSLQEQYQYSPLLDSDPINFYGDTMYCLGRSGRVPF